MTSRCGVTWVLITATGCHDAPPESRPYTTFNAQVLHGAGAPVAPGTTLAERGAADEVAPPAAVAAESGVAAGGATRGIVAAASTASSTASTRSCESYYGEGARIGRKHLDPCKGMYFAWLRGRSGRIDLTLDIEVTGRVSRVSAVATPAHAELESCFTFSALDWTYPPRATPIHGCTLSFLP